MSLKSLFKKWIGTKQSKYQGKRRENLPEKVFDFCPLKDYMIYLESPFTTYQNLKNR